MFARTLTLAVAVVLMAPAVASANDAPEGFTIDSLTYNGTGCPNGTVAKNISPDREAFTLTFSKFVAKVKRGDKLDRKNCQITASIVVPQGWAVGIATVDFRGFVSLDRKMTAVQKAIYYWQGERQQGGATSNFKGPLNEDYTLRDEVTLESITYSPCGAERALNINTSVLVKNDKDQKGQGELTTDSIDGTVEQTYGIVWKRCH